MRKIPATKFIITLIFIVLTVFIYFFSLKYVDTKLNDKFIKALTFIKNEKSSDNVVLVVIDNKSVSKIKWPWTKDLYSDIFDFLQDKAKAKVIVFDNLIIFPDTYNIEKDKEFYSRLKNRPTLINNYVLLKSALSGEILPDEYLDIFDSKNKIKIEDRRLNKKTTGYKAVIKIPKEYLFSVTNLAAAILPEAPDKIVRTSVPIVQFNDKFYPSMALSAYAIATGNYDLVLTDNYLCSNDECKTLKIPLSYEKTTDYIGNSIYAYQTYYDWKKPSSKYYSHKVYSAYDILKSNEAINNGQNPKINPKELENKIVVVGLNADNRIWEQWSETPVSKKTADIDVLATSIDNMLDNSFRTIVNKDFTPIITFMFCIFVIFGFAKFSENLIFAGVLALLYLSYYVYEYGKGIYISSVTPVITIFAAAIFKHVYSVITFDKTTELIKRAMGKYLSKDVMKKVLADESKLKLGGIRTNATLLFVDIRNFTGLSEQIEPQEVSYILNEYFSTIEPIIEHYNGIVNKYLGDGLLAIFGEPINDENHPYNAVKCGLEIINTVKKLREKFAKEGKPLISVGIGINTGEVFAGNIGTDERLDYTVIGDNVNLAYRIEAYNQLLKTQFLISEYTYNYVKDKTDVVKLTNIKIKGKSKPIDIYEVLRIKTDE